MHQQRLGSTLGFSWMTLFALLGAGGCAASMMSAPSAPETSAAADAGDATESVAMGAPGAELGAAAPRAPAKAAPAVDASVSAAPAVDAPVSAAPAVDASVSAAPAASPAPAPPAAAAKRSAAPAAAAAKAAETSPLVVAELEGPRPGQLTAGAWDDNLNYSFFAPYAARLGQLSSDLGVFSPAEQRAARARFEQRQPRRELDVQLVLDTTGSMGDELAYLQSEFGSIVSGLGQRFPNLQPRWSLVVYRDSGDEYVTRRFAFTANTGDFRSILAQQQAGGGGDFPEAVVQAFDVGLDLPWRSDDSVAKVAFWVADAPPHPGEGSRFARLVRRARERGVHLYPVASSGIDDGTEYQMRAAAQLTGGRYLFLTDDSGVGNSHAEPHIPCYQVTRLDAAVVRMLESELRGQHVAVDPEDVVRRVGSPDAEGRCKTGKTLVVAY